MLYEVITEIGALEKERERKQGKEQEYRGYGAQLELPSVHSEEDFYRNLKARITSYNVCYTKLLRT